MSQVSNKALSFCAHTVIVVLLAGNVADAAGLSFNTTYGAGLTALEGSDAALAANIEAGFSQAQAMWSSLVADPITMNVTLDWEDLSSGVLASTSSPDVYISYANVRTALVADQTSANDAVAVANAPPAPSISGYSNMRDGTRIFNTNVSTASTVLALDRTNAKALGLVAANDPGDDTLIRFNSDYFDDWAFTHTPTAGLFDFVGVALHEIGHALGFTSGVSGVDQYTGNGPHAGDDLNGGAAGIGTGEEIPVFKVLDLFRHSDESNSMSAQALDLATGGTPYFQIDGSTALGLFSTGVYNGDGWQPSHWKSNMVDVMRPASSRGQIQDLTALDLMAFDVIGYQIVPEPSSFVLATVAGLGLLTMVSRRRRRR